jgi:RND family efflux transporter MFP subunit
MKKYITAVVISMAIAVSACHHDHNHEADEHDHDHETCSEKDHEQQTPNHSEDKELEGGVVFTKAQQANVEFATEEIQPIPFGQVIRTIAQIQPSQGDERIITAKTSGTVFFNGDITEGNNVVAGKTLCTIDGSTTVNNNLAVSYVEAESEYNRSKEEYERSVKLAKDTIISQSELLQAKTEFINAEANYNNLRRNFSRGKLRISSPISGHITRVSVQNGQFVEAGQPIVIISQKCDSCGLYLKAELQPRFFDVLDTNMSAHIRMLNSNRTYTLEELGGSVLSFGKSVDINNPLIPVTFLVTQRTASLLPGSFVEMFIKTKTNAQAMTVPNEAIVEEMGNFFIFVQHSPELFEKRLIETGVTDGLRTEIRKGLSAGEIVVSKGAILIKLAQVSGALDAHAGHAH